MGINWQEQGTGPMFSELGGFKPGHTDIEKIVEELGGLVSQGEVLVEETDWSFFTHRSGEVCIARDRSGSSRLVSISMQLGDKISVVNFSRDGRGWVKKEFEIHSSS